MIIFRIDVDYPKAPWWENFEVVEYCSEQQQQALLEWMVDERARLLPGRKVIEQLESRRFKIIVMPQGLSVVTWIRNRATV